MSRPATGSVEFRGNPPRWFARVTAKTADGKIVRPWVDLERPDLKNTPEDKRAAKRLALKRAKLAGKSTFVGRDVATAPKVTLKDLEERWFDLLDRDSHLKPGTVVAYKSCWRTNAAPKLGKLPIVSLTVPALRAWVRELTEKLSPSSVNNNAIALTRFLSDARAEGWTTLDSNPMKHEDVRAVLPTVEAPDSDEVVFWTRAEVETLLASHLPDDRFGLYLVAFLHGPRAGELRGLTFGHLTLDGPIPYMNVREQLCLAREAGASATKGTPKTKSSKRVVPLHPAARAWLAWWHAEGWTAHVGRPVADDEPVFPAVDGEAGRPRDANILRRDLKAAELPVDFSTPDGDRLPYTFHATRRTFSRLLGDNGISSEMVGLVLGHAPKSVTERHYMGRSLEAMARAVATLSLTLPERAGVPSAAPAGLSESSRESSRPQTVNVDDLPEVAELLANSYEQPMEFPQLRHL